MGDTRTLSLEARDPETYEKLMESEKLCMYCEEEEIFWEFVIINDTEEFTGDNGKCCKVCAYTWLEECPEDFKFIQFRKLEAE